MMILLRIITMTNDLYFEISKKKCMFSFTFLLSFLKFHKIA